MNSEVRPELATVKARMSCTLDEVRVEAAAKRHAEGYRTARENLADLVDADSLAEYGQLAVAAQRNRRDYGDLQINTAADGVITGVGTINRDLFGKANSRAAVVVYDYEVLADVGSFIELRRAYGPGVVTGFLRLEGKPVGLIANDCMQLGGAVDAEAAEKAARFLQLCDGFELPIISLTDTHSFSVVLNV